MRKLHVALAVLIAVLVLALPQVANAKEAGPVRVVSESGRVGWIKGASARAWWTDLNRWHSGSCVCNSPDAAARFVNRIMQRARWKSHLDGGWPTGMLLIQSGHSGPWLYYPASRTTPPYLVAPAALAKHGREWADWEVVTPQMQRLITSALKKGTASTHTGSSGFPTGWAVGGGLGTLLLASLIVAARRRRDVSARLSDHLRRSRYRPSA
jgi:hypothetical protein